LFIFWSVGKYRVTTLKNLNFFKNRYNKNVNEKKLI
jgi:hypothetical protein